MDRLYVARVPRVITEGPAHALHGLTERCLAHDHVGPDRRQELVPRDQRSGPVDEVAENLPGARVQADGLTGVREPLRLAVDTEITETDCPRGRSRRCCHGGAASLSLLTVTWKTKFYPIASAEQGKESPRLFASTRRRYTLVGSEARHA